MLAVALWSLPKEHRLTPLKHSQHFLIPFLSGYFIQPWYDRENLLDRENPWLSRQFLNNLILGSFHVVWIPIPPLVLTLFHLSCDKSLDTEQELHPFFSRFILLKLCLTIPFWCNFRPFIIKLVFLKCSSVHCHFYLRKTYSTSIRFDTVQGMLRLKKTKLSWVAQVDVFIGLFINMCYVGLVTVILDVVFHMTCS